MSVDCVNLTLNTMEFRDEPCIKADVNKQKNYILIFWNKSVKINY
jgi:hypothetical protein